MRTTTVTLAAALAILQGCTCDTVPATALQDCQAAQVLPDKVQTDILFVIDDSGSMAANQANLVANLGVFIDTLAASPVQNDFRIGVTNTSVEEYDASTIYAGGPFRSGPFPRGAILAVAQGAGGAVTPGDFVYDLAAYPQSGGWGGNRILDAGVTSLQQDFKANVQVGTYGASKEQPFRAARRALVDRLADTNAGFLRPGARLAVFFLTDEDDCSGDHSAAIATDNDCHDMLNKADPALMDTPDGFAAFLLGPIGGELRDVKVGAIAGFDPVTLEPSCGTCADRTCATAYDKADRFAQLRVAMGDARMRLGSICDPSFRNTLLRFAEQLIPTALPLQGTPADWRMLAVKLTQAGGGVVPCAVALDGTPGATAADAIYTPPGFGRPAQLTFQNACTLQLGDRIDVSVVCAG